MTPSKNTCPLWDKCSAPSCPLEPSFPVNTLRGESTCRWLREAVKENGASLVPEAVRDTVMRSVPIALVSGGVTVRRCLLRAQKSGPRRFKSRAAPCAATVEASAGLPR